MDKNIKMINEYSSLSVDDKIRRRIFIIENLEKFISESVYYRNNSLDINCSDPITIGNIEESSMKTRIL